MVVAPLLEMSRIWHPKLKVRVVFMLSTWKVHKTATETELIKQRF